MYISYKPIKTHNMYTIVRMLTDEKPLGTFDNLKDTKSKAKEIISEDSYELNLLICEVINGTRKYLFTV